MSQAPVKPSTKVKALIRSNPRAEKVLGWHDVDTDDDDVLGMSLRRLCEEFDLDLDELMSDLQGDDEEDDDPWAYAEDDEAGDDEEDAEEDEDDAEEEEAEPEEEEAGDTYYDENLDDDLDEEDDEDGDGEDGEDEEFEEEEEEEFEEDE